MSLYRKAGFLSPEQMKKIHESSLYILKNKGVVFKSGKARKKLVEHGAREEGEIVYFPEKLVEECLAKVPSSFRMDAVNPEKAVTIGGDFIIHPAGGETFIQKAEGGRLPTTTIQQFADLQKIYQVCDNINMTGYQPLSPQDVPIETRGLHCLYETMLYTDKPWLAPMDYVSGEAKRRELGMYEIVFGAEWVRSHYLTWSIVTPESPLVFSAFSCESIIEFAEFNQPVALVSAPMSGITGPFFLMGTIVLANAETLAGLCLAECINPGVPVLPSASLTYGNLQNATWECASPESALMLAGAVQMYKEYYDLPARAQTGVTSSKCVDYQAGYETMQSLLLTALLDVDVTSQSAGSLDNLMTISFEKTLIDDEVISRVRRIMDGLAADEEQYGLDAIMEVAHGDNYLTHDSTLDHFMESWQTTISDWNNYETWSRSAYTDIELKAQRRVREIINGSEQILDYTIQKELEKYIERFE